jgi:hypothetical protein
LEGIDLKHKSEKMRRLREGVQVKEGEGLDTKVSEHVDSIINAHYTPWRFTEGLFIGTIKGSINIV